MGDSDNQYTLEHFEMLAYREVRVVLYGGGHWYGHVMDWAGLNMYHGRLPGSPVFRTPTEALTWLRDNLDKYKKDDWLNGHHAGEFECSKGCGDRDILDFWFYWDTFNNDEDFNELVNICEKQFDEWQELNEVFNDEE